MPRRTKKDNAGWPEHTKDPVEREQRIAEKMASKRFADVILKSDKNIIPWNLVQKLKHTHD